MCLITKAITKAITKTFPYLLAIAPLAAASGAHAGTLGSFTSDAKGFDTHTYWYDDGQEVTVIDTQFVPALTEAMVAKIRASTASPITRVIVTHPNPDKFNGLSVLHALGAESIASARTAAAMPGVHAYKKYFWTQVAKSFLDADYPKLEAVKTTFSGRYTVRLKSGETLSLIELKNPAVSSTQTVVRIDRTGDLLVGDLVHHQAHLWLEGGIVDGKPAPDLQVWKAALAELPALGSGRVYGGRGEVGTVKEVVAAGRTYLQRADDLVTGYVRRVPAAELKDATQAQPHYAAIQKELEAAFPDYALGYLVGYGVYGLVNSKLAN
jgi:glyoxylase-like metal-dependent hydrolase (beta-lactamase superfamily II)